MDYESYNSPYSTLFSSYGHSFIGLVGMVFQVWMLIDCIRERRDAFWYFIILIWGIGPLIYFITFRPGFDLAGGGLLKRWHLKNRITELKTKIHHIGNAYHYTELGDVYLKMEKWDEAGAAYEAALQQEPDAQETRVHLGYVRLAQGRPQEAWDLMAPTLEKKPDLEYGELMWQAAKAQVALGNLEAARDLYQRLTTRHNYARAQYEYAEVLKKLGAQAESRQMLEKILADAPHTPKFQARKERKWVRQARRALAELKA